MCGNVRFHLACDCTETKFTYCDKATKKGTPKGTVNVSCGSGKPPGNADLYLTNRCAEHRAPKPYDPWDDPSRGSS